MAPCSLWDWLCHALLDEGRGKVDVGLFDGVQLQAQLLVHLQGHQASASIRDCCTSTIIPGFTGLPSQTTSFTYNPDEFLVQLTWLLHFKRDNNSRSHAPSHVWEGYTLALLSTCLEGASSPAGNLNSGKRLDSTSDRNFVEKVCSCDTR